MTTHAVGRFEDLHDIDELAFDRLPGTPLLGFFAGTLLSLGLWGAVALIAWVSA